MAPLDPFDYELQDKHAVSEEHRLFPPNFSIRGQYTKYPSGDQRVNNENNLDNRDRIAKLVVDIR